MARDRLFAFAGILFAILFIIGILLASSLDTSEGDARILKHINDSGTQITLIIGGYLTVIAGIMLLYFSVGLRKMLGAAEGGSEMLSSFAQVGGVVCGTLIIGGAILLVTPAAAIKFGGVPDPTNGDVVRMIPQIGAGFVLLGAMFTGIAMMLPASVVTLQTRVLPAWFGWLGVVCSIALLFGVVFIPAVALPLWVLIASVLVLRSHAVEVQTAAAPA